MSDRDFFSILSKLMSEFLKLKNDQGTTKKLDKDDYKNKCEYIFEKVRSLKSDKDNEIQLKKNCVTFLERIINDEFYKNEEIKEVKGKINNVYKEEKKDFINKEQEKEIKKKITDENKNLNKSNENDSSNIYLHSNKNMLKVNKTNNIVEKIKSEIDVLFSHDIHIDFINKIKIYFSKNDDIKNIKNHPKIDLNNLYNRFLEINNKMKGIEIGENYFSKYFTLLFSVYPFFSPAQKNKLFSSINLNTYPLFKHLLIILYEDKEIIAKLINGFFLIENFNKEETLDILCKKIFETSPDNKSILYYSYLLRILITICNKYNNPIYDKTNQLSFKLHFLLSNNKLLPFNSEQFLALYNDLLFINNFYATIFKTKIKEPYLIKIKDNKLIYNNKNFSDNNITDISLLFNEKDNENFERIMNPNNGIIPHFYFINEMNNNQLIDDSSYLFQFYKKKFLENIISLTYIKSEFIEKNLGKFKDKLINLETEIYNLAKISLCGEKNISGKANKINQYKQKYKEKSIFKSFKAELYEKMSNLNGGKYKDKYKLFPVGSLTEFLSMNKSDIDIYLYIEGIEDGNINFEILKYIFECVKELGRGVKKIISHRICVIELEYKNTEFDLSILGYPLYIHSLIFREYSLIDARLPMIGLAIKSLKDVLCFDKKYFINSFCWMTLLTIFLQDIINPPILPKLYSNKDGNLNNIIFEDIFFGYNKNNKDSFRVFLSNLKKEKIPLHRLLDRKKIREIYEKQIGNNKNELSCAEILLKFIEFIACYLKYDTIYAEYSINGEGFFNMNDIKDIYINNKNYIDKDMDNYNYEFYKYFTKRYLKYKYKTKRDGFILIRDPVDNHYNPGQKFQDENNLKIFINYLRFAYSVLIKHGSLKKLEEIIKMKEKNK